MRLTIERSAFFKALSHVQSVVERRNTIPILSNVLLSAETDRLRLSATDLDIEVSEYVASDVARPGASSAPAQYLHDFVRKLPDDATITLEVKEGETRLTLRGGPAHLQLPVLSAADFPLMPMDGFEARFLIHPTELKRLIDKTRFAISTEETRYYLNGIFMHGVTVEGASLLRAVATDGHRLALAETTAPDGAMAMPGVIVPRKTITELRRLLDDAPDVVEVAVSPHKIRFAVGDAVITSKLIDGNFPEYSRVIPKGNDRHLRVTARPFAQAVDRVSTVSAERSRSVRMALSDGAMTLTVNNPDAGLATEDLEVDYTAQGMEIGFNARYLLDVTDQVEGESAVFSFADSGAPTLVKDEADPHALYVLMPLRV